MATLTSPAGERRHIPDRRMGARAATMNMPSGMSHMSSSADASSSISNRSLSGSISRMNALDWIAMTLMIIGGLNWGLVGLFQIDLVARLFGEMSAVSRTIYALVGLAAVYSIYTSSKLGKMREHE